MAGRARGTVNWSDLQARFALALYGLAVAITIAPYLQRPAPATQLPGYAKNIAHLDARAPFWFVLTMALFPILFPIVLRPLVCRLAEGWVWARNGATMAAVVAMWSTVMDQHFVRSVVPEAIAIVVCGLLAHIDLRFTRRDVILIPSTLTAFIAFIDLLPKLDVQDDLVIAGSIVLAIRVILAFLPRRDVEPALSFALAPLGLMLQTSFFSYDQRHMGWPSLALVVITPFVLRPLLRDVRRWRAVLAFVSYPIAAFGYQMSTGLIAAEGKPRANFFEGGHSLMTASEMLRGEKVYRDVLPAHGLIEDGLLDYLTLRFGQKRTIGATLKMRDTIGAFDTIALYAVGYAMTGSPEAGFCAFLLAMTYASAQTSVRVLPAMAALAFILAAVWRRRPRFFGYAAFAIVVAGLTSLDFAAYTFIVLVVAILRSGGQKLRAVRAAGMGFAAAGVPLLVALLIAGILRDFLVGTFVEIPSMAAAYTLDLFFPPDVFGHYRQFPEALLAIFDKPGYLYVYWVVAVLVVATLIARRPRRRLETILLGCLFVVAASISYAERHHLHYSFIITPLLVAFAFRLFRGGRRVAGSIAVLVMIAGGFASAHMAVVGMLRRAHGPMSLDVTEIGDLPRARGAFWSASDAALIASVKKYADIALAPDETFFDFTNRGILYFLLNRDCPIREEEVAYYEPEARQRAVIAALERNRHVRAALIGKPGDATVDGIPNEVRAPLVWEYIRGHFHPDFEEGNVVFWRRND